MTELIPLMEHHLTKGEKVAVANPTNLVAYLIGVVTETNGKQIVVETNESEFFFAVDGYGDEFFRHTCNSFFMSKVTRLCLKHV